MEAGLPFRCAAAADCATQYELHILLEGHLKKQFPLAKVGEQRSNPIASTRTSERQRGTPLAIASYFIWGPPRQRQTKWKAIRKVLFIWFSRGRFFATHIRDPTAGRRAHAWKTGMGS